VSEEGIDFEREGLLQGLEGAQRQDRLALLSSLTQAGVPLSELARHTREGTILFLPAERVIGGPQRYTAAEIAQLSGQSVEFLVAARRAMGLPVPGPDERVYIDADLEATRMAAIFKAAGVSEQDSLEVLRILGRGLSQSAEAIRTLGMRLVIEPGVSEHDLAERFAATAAQLTPMLGPLITNLLTLHLRQMADTEAIDAAERFGGRLPGSREIAVCFADLVGFTRLGEDVPAHELSRLAIRLEQLAGDVAHQPVRLVKTIGDAAMLTSPEPAPLIEAALSLIEAADAEGEQFPQLRAGVTIGPALSRAGDWFGRPVNLASRVTQVARPGSLLTEGEVRAAVGDRYRWSYAGERRLRGVREPVALYRARRPAA
jgi:adenylate cyclase